MKIDQIWEGLEAETGFHTGLLYRRYSGDIMPDIVVGIKAPEKLRCIAIKIHKAIKVDLKHTLILKDIRIELSADDRNPELNKLVILLANQQHRDIFSPLCEDLINSVADVEDERILVNNLLNRFEKWKSLFEKAGLQGLTPEEQRGLYGELFFLRKWIPISENKSRCIKSWIGPGKSVRDFQIEEWALEVKTTHGNNHQKVSITSERQLDTSTVQNVFLFHLSMDVQQSTGENLNAMVETVKTQLIEDMPTLSEFNYKLIEAGYYNHHQHLYIDRGYHVRQENVYQVRDEFPRIEESDIRNGVGDVKYSIILSTCTDYQITENDLFTIINNNTDG